jgi:hypothetical protein
MIQNAGPIKIQSAGESAGDLQSAGEVEIQIAVAGEDKSAGDGPVTPRALARTRIRARVARQVIGHSRSGGDQLRLWRPRRRRYGNMNPVESSAGAGQFPRS